MPIMRNPFRKQDENVRPVTANGGLEKVGDRRPPQAIDIKEKQPAEYKLSEINDSGVFVPPSPPNERRSFWTSSSRSTTSSNHRSVFNENEPFNISRESFDSYRRSFDISARSPVILPEQKPRISLDSRTFQPPTSRNSNSFHRPLQVPRTQKEEEPERSEDTADGESKLEDVSLDDPKPQQPPKKRGMFSRMLPDSSSSESHHERPTSSDGGKWHHFGGRKRGQSGQGSELGSIPTVKREETPKPESQLRKEVKPAAAESQAVLGAETTQAPISSSNANATVEAAVVR